MNINLLVKIRNNETGEVRDYFTDHAVEYEDTIVYLWEEGNYSCDCNREIFFIEATGAEADYDATMCGDGKYSVSVTDKDTGKIYYSEL